MPASRADFLWEEEGEDYLVILVVRADLTLQASLGDQVNPQDRRTGSAGFRLLFLCHPLAAETFLSLVVQQNRLQTRRQAA